MIGPVTEMTKNDPPRCLAIHEFAHFNGLTGSEAEASKSTPWSQKVLEDSSVFIARGWQLIKPEGYKITERSRL